MGEAHSKPANLVDLEYMYIRIYCGIQNAEILFIRLFEMFRIIIALRTKEFLHSNLCSHPLDCIQNPIAGGGISTAYLNSRVFGLSHRICFQSDHLSAYL